MHYKNNRQNRNQTFIYILSFTVIIFEKYYLLYLFIGRYT